MVTANHSQRFLHITDKLGEILKETRLALGYTREQLSERTGVTERYIAAIENEGQIPRVIVLNALLHGLGLSADRIFYPDAEQEDPDLDHLMRLIQLCDAEDRKVIAAVVDALLDRRKKPAENVYR